MLRMECEHVGISAATCIPLCTSKLVLERKNKYLCGSYVQLLSDTLQPSISVSDGSPGAQIRAGATKTELQA